ncbi:hypothetical protein [Sinosporangium siamense]|uniref:Uncharacterized protein n=1 Tax=Sinosporangium siamense TaxID=1367973 RepID=A0A919RJC8_9ACTN|nr:hypothetical protein [Sinosporangium siamense]GII94332.1 hypothetical protein Ssi02_45630 [Sinosporangium siamense]
MALSLLLRTRMIVPALLVSVAASVVAFLAARYAIVVDVFGPAVRAPRVPVIEVVAVATSVAVAWLLRPRFWEWEKLGGAHVRRLAAGTALAGMLLPLLPVCAGVVRVPGDARAWLLLPAVALLSAVTFAGAALAGPVFGGLLSAAVLFGGAVLVNLQPGAAHLLPIAYATGRGLQVPLLPGWWLAAPVAVALAVAVHALTCGASARSRRLSREDE